MRAKARSFESETERADFCTYLRSGRYAPSLEYKSNPNHDTVTGRFTTGPGVHLTPESAHMASRIGAGFHLRTGKTLHVTSGTRTPEQQAKAMLDKGVETWPALYRDHAAIQQIRDAHDGAIESGAGQSGAIAAMAATIRQQEQRGQYISLHLKSHALDLRTLTLSAREQAILASEARRQGGRIIMEGGREKHLHVQF